MQWIVIMAGGGGTRLWPLSRRKQPKQFLPLLPGGETLLGATVARVSSLVPIERTVVVTAASQVDEVRRTVPALPVNNIVVEPMGRNTAPCIGLATVEVLRRDPEAVIGVVPSDQHVRDVAGFCAAMQQAFAAAQKGQIAVVGIRPSAPETGFGYIQASAAVAHEIAPAASGVRVVERFVEKPDKKTAEHYVTSGNYLWNAGMFFFPARRMLDEIRRYMPELAGILDEIAGDAGRCAALYPAAPKISIDYGVMEKLPLGSGGLCVVPGDFGWNDVGSWAALAEVHPLDEAGNAVVGEAITIDARDNVLVGGGRLIAAVGVEGLVVVVTDDAVLVMPRDRAQDVKRVVEALEAGKRDNLL